MASWSLTLLVFIGCAVVLKWLLFGRKHLPLGCREMPGPRGLPWIGRVHDLPADKPWLKFAEWSIQHGPIYQHTTFGQLHIWVSKESMVQDIFAKNGAIASDRPEAFANVPGAKEWKYLPLEGHHEAWKRQRKLAYFYLQQAYEARYWGYTDLEIPRLLNHLVKNPKDWSSLLESYLSRFLSRLAFATPEHGSALCTNAYRLLVNISPGGRASNVIPGAMKLPRFIAWWKADEEDRSEKEEELYGTLQKEIYEKYLMGAAPPSFSRIYFENRHKYDFPNDLEAAFNVSMPAMAGILTTTGPLHTFFLAMVHHPQWLSKLQTEIDAVCGDRPPRMDDMPALPLLRAIIKECIRWRPTIPIGIPHEIEADIIYDGYFFPKGAWVHPMEWRIARDPEMYPDPDTFNPGRWLEPEYPTFKAPLTKFPTLFGHHQFGWGRRVCVGVNVVETQTFCILGGVAWAFNIRKRKDTKGIDVEVPQNDYHGLVITKPNPFQFTLEVRSDKKQEQIERLHEKLTTKESG